MLTDWLFWGSGIALGIFGLWLMWWSLFSDRSRGRRRCPKCWYDMSGTDDLRCPECGRKAKSKKKLRNTRRRWRRAMVAIIPLIIATLIQGRPLWHNQKWHRIVSTPMLIQIISTFESIWAFDALTKRLGIMKEVSLDDWVYGNSYRPIHGQYMGTPRDLVLSSMDEKRWSKLRMVLLAILNESQKTELLIKSLVAIGTYDLIDETCGETLVNLLDHSNQDVRRLAAAGLCYELP